MNRYVRFKSMSDCFSLNVFYVIVAISRCVIKYTANVLTICNFFFNSLTSFFFFLTFFSNVHICHTTYYSQNSRFAASRSTSSSHFLILRYGCTTLSTFSQTVSKSLRNPCLVPVPLFRKCQHVGTRVTIIPLI